MLAQVVNYGRLVKFSHTIFAMPFALSMWIMLSAQNNWEYFSLLWILLALVSARTSAMTFNRLVDCSYDKQNVRTAKRELPTNAVSARAAWILLLLSVAVFFLSAALLGSHCLKLAPFVLLVLLGYSYTKRFTVFSHMVLGLALSLAPGGVWYALTARFDWLPVILMAGVLFWVSGFDILYSCQDFEFDRKLGLFSIPAELGLENAFIISRLFHCLAVVFLVWFGLSASLSAYYFIGLTIFSMILLSQHRLVTPNDLSKINEAFFKRNGLASIIYFLSVAFDVVSR